MNLDTSQSSDNGTTSSSSTSSCRALIPNGGCSEKLYNWSNKDLSMSFPPGGCTSLRLPVLWDVSMDSRPVAAFQVHEYLRPKLCDLYENDSIFGKFNCCLSGDGLRVATGSYSNLFRVFGCAPGSMEVTTLEASRNLMRAQILHQVALSTATDMFTMAKADNLKQVFQPHIVSTVIWMFHYVSLFYYRATIPN